MSSIHLSILFSIFENILKVASTLLQAFLHSWEQDIHPSSWSTFRYCLNFFLNSILYFDNILRTINVNFAFGVYPHENALKCGDLGGPGTCPIWKTIWFGNNYHKTSINVRAVWAVVTSCWNHISYRLWWRPCNSGVIKFCSTLTYRVDVTVAAMPLPASRKKAQ